MQTRNYICYYGVGWAAEPAHPLNFASAEDLLMVLSETAGDVRHKGICRLDLEIPDNVSPTLMRYIFMGLLAERGHDPTNYVFVICEEGVRGLDELNIRLKEAIDAARNAFVPWSEVAAALTEFANPE